jgi:hypothetical protein
MKPIIEGRSRHLGLRKLNTMRITCHGRSTRPLGGMISNIIQVSAAGICIILMLTAVGCLNPPGVYAIEQYGQVQTFPSPLKPVSTLAAGPGQELRLDLSAYELLKSQRKLRIDEFHVSPGRTVDLELKRFSIFDENTQFVMGTNDGDEPMPAPDVVTLRGIVVGHEGSEVFLGLSPYGCNGYVSLDDEIYFLAARPGRDGDGEQLASLIYAQSSIDWPQPDRRCETVMEAPDPDLMLRAEEPGAAPLDFYKICDLAVDTDSELCDSLFSGHVGAAATYLVELWSAISITYDRDLRAKLYICYLRIHSGGVDPYLEPGSTGEALTEFKLHWMLFMDGVSRTVAHKCSGTPGAGLSLGLGLCSKVSGYSVTCVRGGFPDPAHPEYLWDIQAPGHELGHNFGSPHTHCYVPPIDSCSNCEKCEKTCPGYPGDCYGCPDCTGDCYHGPIACTRGTLMSYCDGCSPDGLRNKEMRFHPRAIALIRLCMALAPCMDFGLDPVYVDISNTGHEDGSLAFPFNTIAEAVRVVIPGGTIKIRGGHYPENPWIREDVTLEHYGDPLTPVTIGQ